MTGLGRRKRIFADDVELDATIVSPPRVARIVVNGTIGTEALRREACRRDAALDQPLHDGLRPMLAEDAIVGRCAGVVGVPLYPQQLDVRVVAEDLENRVEDLFTVLAWNDGGARRGELHLIANLDLPCLDIGLRAPILLRIGVLRPWSVGTGVRLVRDPILVTIGIGAA